MTQRRWYEKHKLDPEFRLQRALRDRARRAISGAGLSQTGLTLLGCTIPEVRKHIESLWEPGMTWENYGVTGWHIDHIKPLTAFNLGCPEECALACHYTNLRPLWAKDNTRKGDRFWQDGRMVRGKDVRPKLIALGPGPRTYCTPPKGWTG